jgi:hypothetical protein
MPERQCRFTQILSGTIKIPRKIVLIWETLKALLDAKLLNAAAPGPGMDSTAIHTG